MATPLLPKPRTVARAALLAQTAITTIVGTRVLLAVPDPWPTDANGDLQVIVLDLVDDDELRPETLDVRVQVNCWGAGSSTIDSDSCEDTASTVRSIARDLNGDWAEGKIRNCVAGLIIPAPDPKTGRARHVVDLTFELNQ